MHVHVCLCLSACACACVFVLNVLKCGILKDLQRFPYFYNFVLPEETLVKLPFRGRGVCRDRADLLGQPILSGQVKELNQLAANCRLDFGAITSDFDLPIRIPRITQTTSAMKGHSLG